VKTIARRTILEGHSEPGRRREKSIGDSNREVSSDFFLEFKGGRKRARVLGTEAI